MGRRKLVENDELLAVAREAFVEKGVAASTREIARRAGISEAVIYQRHPTKAHLFFAAMVPPALNVEDLLAAPANDLSVLEQIEGIALGMMEYFREVVPILMPLMTHPEFDPGTFAQRHPDSPFGRMHLGLMKYLETQRERGGIVAEDVAPAALTLIAALHSLAFFERLGAHGGRFDQAILRAMVRRDLACVTEFSTVRKLERLAPRVRRRHGVPGRSALPATAGGGSASQEHPEAKTAEAPPDGRQSGTVGHPGRGKHWGRGLLARSLDTAGGRVPSAPSSPPGGPSGSGRRSPWPP